METFIRAGFYMEEEWSHLLVEVGWEALESCQGHLFCPPPNLLWQTVLDPYSTAHLLSGRASSLFRCWKCQILAFPSSALWAWACDQFWVKRVWKSNLFWGQGRLQRTDFLPIKTRERHAWGNSLHSSILFLHLVVWGSTIWRDDCATLKGDATHRLRRADGKEPASWRTLVQYSKNLAVGQAWHEHVLKLAVSRFLGRMLCCCHSCFLLHIMIPSCSLLST